jgi:hypothetical protein
MTGAVGLGGRITHLPPAGPLCAESGASHQADPVGSHRTRSHPTRVRRVRAYSPAPPRRRGAARPARRLPPRTLEIFKAIPVGSRRARDQMGWVADVLDDPEVGQMRADGRRNFAEVVRVLARYADWKDRTTRPTWARIGEQAGVSRSVVARTIRWLREHGYLGTVVTGSTPMIRTGVLYGLSSAGEENEAAEYVLCTPGRTSQRRQSRPVRTQPTQPCAGDPDITDTPSRSRQGPRSTPPREHRSETERPRHWPMTRRPATRGEMLAAAEMLRRRTPLLRRITARHLRSLVKGYFQRGWTPADVLYAIDHYPDGRQHPHTDRVRHVPGWIRYRLAAWHNPHDPLADLYPTPSQLAADHARTVRAEQRQRAAQLAAARAARVDPATGPAAAVRRALAAANPASALAKARAVRRAAEPPPPTPGSAAPRPPRTDPHPERPLATSAGSSSSQPPAAGRLSPAGSVSATTAAAAATKPDVASTGSTTRPTGLARRLLTATTDAERAAIIAALTANNRRHPDGAS